MSAPPADARCPSAPSPPRPCPLQRYDSWVPFFQKININTLPYPPLTTSHELWLGRWWCLPLCPQYPSSIGTTVFHSSRHRALLSILVERLRLLLLVQRTARVSASGRAQHSLPIAMPPSPSPTVSARMNGGRGSSDPRALPPTPPRPRPYVGNHARPQWTIGSDRQHTSNAVHLHYMSI
jgi:hypothetical protein